MSGYVQCPSCKTIFRLGPHHLDAHHGLVRCGRCRHVFNGKRNLLDELPPAARGTHVAQIGQNPVTTADLARGTRSDSARAVEHEHGESPVRPPLPGSAEIELVAQQVASFDQAHVSSEDDDSDSTATTIERERPRFEKQVDLAAGPQPRVWRTMLWLLAALVLLGLSVWQLKHHYLDELAQVTRLRPHLTKLCDWLDCVVPPRRAFGLLDLVGTSVNAHPHSPGALRVSINLLNRASFRQPYPLLEITLTDTGGRVVGRRTYSPKEYLVDGARLLPPSVIQKVDLDLAQPSDTAIGYEIQLVQR